MIDLSLLEFNIRINLKIKHFHSIFSYFHLEEEKRKEKKDR